MTHAIAPERRRKLSSPRVWGAVVLALGLTALTGSFDLLSRCDHPWAIPCAFVAGHLLFGASQAFLRLSLRQGWHALLASVRLVYRPYGGETLVFYFLLATSEELVFRAIPLESLGGAWWQILVLAVVFSAIHIAPRRTELPILPAFDYLVLGVILGATFVWLGDLWPLVIVHWVRNASVAKVFVRRVDGRQSTVDS